ncbi:ubiquinol-cytochrome c reductase iron-sulfur subunit [Halorussus limi]|uniref:Ubiquinol-cytochrome c reductase iron-sulfur subunit n=1 Tax=Halorussus limi TaxID=2938695 RepID=A0A8U0HWC8_9EURY|nr:ubiquinol-cytochrome c reductase iron-sulfur subunit [Halorussus limi]UPV74904.1 ubiquinol-cytochrome c reductase iron-sulfur subunit [Halorussus limi]
MDEDKYPPENDRRRFVKGVVGSATLTSAGTAATAALDATTSPTGGTGGPTDYVGIKNTDGPAPRGMPVIPLTIDDEGFLKGIWPDVKEKKLKDGSTITITEQEIGGVTYTGRWFQYCGVQNAEGLIPDADQDNYFRSKPGLYDWQSDHDRGQKLHVDDFDDYKTWSNGIGSAGAGKPAQTTWRSQSDGGDVTELPVQVLRSPKVADLPAESENPEFLRAATESNFIAWLDKCTHFCCTPGFNASQDASKFDATDAVYCQCHQSVYDPFAPVELSFNAFPRPDD